MHAPHLLRGLGVAVIMSAVLALSACGISYDVTIHDDDTLDQTILIWDSGGVMGKSDCSAKGMGASGATAPPARTSPTPSPTITGIRPAR